MEWRNKKSNLTNENDICFLDAHKYRYFFHKKSYLCFKLIITFQLFLRFCRGPCVLLVGFMLARLARLPSALTKWVPLTCTCENFRSHFAKFFANLHIFCEKKLSMKMRNYARFRENTMSVVAIITINCTKKTCGILSKICLIKTYRVNKGIKVYNLKTHDANTRRFMQGWRWDFYIYSDINLFNKTTCTLNLVVFYLIQRCWL